MALKNGDNTTTRPLAYTPPGGETFEEAMERSGSFFTVNYYVNECTAWRIIILGSGIEI